MQKLLASAVAGATLLVSAGVSANEPATNTVSNFATGGARTDAANLTTSLVPGFDFLASQQGLVVNGLQQQIGWATQTLAGDIDSQKDLFVVWAGTNDLLGAVLAQSQGAQIDWNAVMGGAAGNIYGALEAMSALGGEYFLVPNLPSLSTLPMIVGAVGGDPSQLAGLEGLTAGYNYGVLAPTIAAFQAAHPNAVVVTVDIFAANAFGLAAGGFANTTGACYNAQIGQIPPAADTCDVVRDGSGNVVGYNYAFVDTVHPTERLYTFWADAAVVAVKNALEASKKPSAKGNLRGGFRRIVTLGDSFSDTGAFDNLWNRVFPFDFLPDVTYTRNRFSTGDGFIDMLEAGLRVKPENVSSAYIQ